MLDHEIQCSAKQVGRSPVPGLSLLAFFGGCADTVEAQVGDVEVGARSQLPSSVVQPRLRKGVVDPSAFGRTTCALHELTTEHLTFIGP